MFFLYKSSDDPFTMGFYLFIFPFLTSSQSSTCRLDCWLRYQSHQHILEVSGNSCKAENHCSGITSTLMRSESQLQSIQCSGSSFLLDISQLPFILCPPDIYPSQQNRLECCTVWQIRPFDLCFAQSEEAFLLRIPSQTFLVIVLSQLTNSYSFTKIYLSSDYSTSLDEAHDPIYIPRPYIPTIAPRNFLPLLLGKKGISIL